MYKKIACLVIAFIFALCANAQIPYPIVGQYKGRSAQGMAIYKDYAFLFSDGGLCRTLNLKTGVVDGEFFLESAGKNTHVNCACFSRQFVTGYSLPALYITEFYGKRRCFVELIKDGKSKLIQTIEYVNRQGTNPFVREWIVDNKNQTLYAVIREGNRQKNNIIKKFLLPKLESGSSVILTDDNVIDEFSVVFENALQGGVIYGRNMYIATGSSSLHGEEEYLAREIKVIDLKRKVLVKSINLKSVTMNEPEDIDFYKGKCFLYAEGTGGIYRVF